MGITQKLQLLDYYKGVIVNICSLRIPIEVTVVGTVTDANAVHP